MAVMEACNSFKEEMQKLIEAACAQNVKLASKMPCVGASLALLWWLRAWHQTPAAHNQHLVYMRSVVWRVLCMPACAFVHSDPLVLETTDCC